MIIELKTIKKDTLSATAKTHKGYSLRARSMRRATQGRHENE